MRSPQPASPRPRPRRSCSARQTGPVAAAVAQRLLVVRLACANLDGQVARRRGTSSPRGALVNEVGDRVADLLPLLGLLAAGAGPAARAARSHRLQRALVGVTGRPVRWARGAAAERADGEGGAVRDRRAGSDHRFRCQLLGARRRGRADGRPAPAPCDGVAVSAAVAFEPATRRRREPIAARMLTWALYGPSLAAGLIYAPLALSLADRRRRGLGAGPRVVAPDSAPRAPPPGGRGTSCGARRRAHRPRARRGDRPAACRGH